jgi:hypothetical protein
MGSIGAYVGRCWDDAGVRGCGADAGVLLIVALWLVLVADAVV